MEKLILNKREITGKGNKKLLKDGITPAVVYNAKTESTNVQLPTDIASQIVRETTSTTILEADVDGKTMKLVVRDLDINPLTEEIRHISFFEIDENADMNFFIPFEITGVSPAVKNNLGILVNLLSAIEVKGKVGNLVDKIVIDISTLAHPGQTIAVSDIELPEGMVLANADQDKAAIVTITQLQKAEVLDTTETDEEAEEGEEAEGSEESTEEGSEE
jgi:large subunit ribosomal protein L25